MCDEGRFGFDYVHSDERLTQPTMRTATSKNAVGWDVFLPELRLALQSAARRGRLAVVLSPWATVEEGWLLASWLKSLSPSVLLAMGPVRTVGEDDVYPKDVHGDASEAPKFIIRAEKCPNRRGIEEIIRHFEEDVPTVEQILADAEASEIDAVYLLGGDPVPWMTSAQAATLKRLRLLVVQDIHPSPASYDAHFLVPGASFAEKDGTFVNHAGLAQAIRRSIHSPGDARADGRILWDLAGRRGLFNAANLRREIAAEVPAFAALAAGDLGEHGILLTTTESEPVEEPVAVHGVREIRTN
jgi:NADH-quinone oxidoreductase subunit G